MHRIGDYPLAIYLSMKGKVHYFPQIMSKYRIASKNSWTKNLSKSKDSFIEAKLTSIKDLKRLDELTDHKYTSSFDLAERRVEYQILVKRKKLWDILCKKDYKRFLFEKGLKRSIRTIGGIILK